MNNRIKSAYNLGWNACENGSSNHPPSNFTLEEKEAWYEGWDDCDDDIDEESEYDDYEDDEEDYWI